MGYLHVFDAASGELLWESRLNERFKIEMPIWGIAAAPLVYGNQVILHIGGQDGACLVSLDVATGEELWRALDDRGSYSSPVLTRQANQDVLIAWTGDHVAGIDPKTGTVHWKSPMPPKNMVIGIATPVIDRGQVFVTSFYDGAKMMQLDDRFVDRNRSLAISWAKRTKHRSACTPLSPHPFCEMATSTVSTAMVNCVAWMRQPDIVSGKIKPPHRASVGAISIWSRTAKPPGCSTKWEI